MNQDLVLFLATAVLLVVYLVFSAKTEMGTKINFRWPWRK